MQLSQTQLPQLSGEQVVTGLQSLLSTSLIFSYVVLFLEFVMFPQATRYGYRDVFNDAVSFALRKEFEAPAHGEVEVRYWEGGTPPSRWPRMPRHERTAAAAGVGSTDRPPRFETCPRGRADLHPCRQILCGADGKAWLADPNKSSARPCKEGALIALRRGLGYPDPEKPTI